MVRSNFHREPMSETLPDKNTHRCWAEVDLSALSRNASACQQAAGETCELMAIVKADAYGHGLSRIVSALSQQLNWFGVATLNEAITAASAVGGSNFTILILSPCLPGEREKAIGLGFSVSVSTREELEDYSSIADQLKATARIHLKVDTGMGRMGCEPAELSHLIDLSNSLPGLELEGVCTHFPSADEDPEFTRKQIEKFQELTAGLDNVRLHIANSAGLLGFQHEINRASLVRPGLAIYGISPLENDNTPLHPTLSLKTRVTLVRSLEAGNSVSYGRTFIATQDMRVATLGVGYGDGYPRHLSNTGAEVLIQGKRCPLLGRVTMDQIVVDVSHLESSPAPGEEAVLIGQQGEEEITAVELAEKAGTIPWEILTGITSRVDRVYV